MLSSANLLLQSLTCVALQVPLTNKETISANRQPSRDYENNFTTEKKKTGGGKGEDRTALVILAVDTAINFLRYSNLISLSHPPREANANKLVGIAMSLEPWQELIMSGRATSLKKVERRVSSCGRIMSFTIDGWVSNQRRNHADAVRWI